jgi:hypothetical protein
MEYFLSQISPANPFRTYKVLILKELIEIWSRVKSVRTGRRGGLGDLDTRGFSLHLQDLETVICFIDLKFLVCVCFANRHSLVSWTRLREPWIS